MNKTIVKTFPLGFQWPTQEPFLFCVHHHDFYPKGNQNLGVDEKYLKGRDMGQDFEVRDGFRMYHGEEVPGFPVHPHRGFETVTIVRKGYIDHSDSLGATARFGEGDVQWLTAGKGIQHSEMFPLLKPDAENTVELFQIWLNLPRASKMAEPNFTMFWSEKIPQLKLANGKARLSLIAGSFNCESALAPPPASWASQEGSEVAIWLLKLEKDAAVELPASRNEVTRTLYFFDGRGLLIDGEEINSATGAQVDSRKDIMLESRVGAVELLVLQAKPIGEPIVQHGPFVMNAKEEIMQTFRDFERTQFGGWSFPRHDMVHGKELQRFARHPDGKLEKPT